jgi:hypothetical protein
MKEEIIDDNSQPYQDIWDNIDKNLIYEYFKKSNGKYILISNKVVIAYFVKEDNTITIFDKDDEIISVLTKFEENPFSKKNLKDFKIQKVD